MGKGALDVNGSRIKLMTEGILANRTMASSARMDGVSAGKDGNPFDAGAWTADEEQVEAVKQQILKKLRIRMAAWHSTQEQAGSR